MKILFIAAIALASAALAQEDSLPPLARGVELVDEHGNPETGLVDPFAKPARPAAEEEQDPGLMRTGLGEIPGGFKILGISIPAEGGARAALVQPGAGSDPVLVHEGDLVRIDRPGAKDDAERFVFYVNVKKIEPGYIEIYHNKKRPDESVRLNW